MTSSARAACASLVIPCATLALVAGLSFDGSFELSAIWRMCAISAVAPAAIAAAAMLRKTRPVPLWVTLATSAAAWAIGVPMLAGTLAAPGSGAVPGGWLTVLRMAVTDAPRQLLTITPPVAATAVLLAGLGSMIWWAAAWSAEAAVRTAAAGRVSVVAVLPGAVVLLAGTAAGVPRGSASLLWPAVAFVAAFALLLAAERAVAQRVATPSAGGGERRLLVSGGRFGLAAATTVVMAAAALLIVPVLPGLASRPPADPRQLVKPVAHVQPLIDPLGLVSAWLSAPPRLLFTVRTANPVNLSWLVLDQYDGAAWSSTARYAPAGLVLPAEPGAATPGHPVVEQVAVLPHANMPGTWLPAAARPTRLSGAAARFDPASGILATLEGTSVDGLTYQVSSSIPTPGVAQLADAVPGSGPAVDAERVLPPGVPAVVSAYGTSAMAGAGSPYQQMLLLQDRLLRDFRYNPRAAPGQSYGHLAIFVGRNHVGGPGVFATLFAVLARQAGFAARLAVGFLPGHRVGQDLYLVTTADVLVWPEVYFRGLGWVPFYPLPRPGSGKNGALVRPLGQPASRTTLNQKITRGQGSGAGTHRGQHPPGIVTGSRPKRSGSMSFVVYLLAGVLALALCYLVVAATVRLMIRRRWRRRTDPRGRVAGAWQDALSGLTAAGGIALTTLTPEQVVEHAVAVAGSDAQAPATLLAGLANVALFSPVEPRPDEADAARLAASQVRRLARRRTPIRARGAGLLRPYPAGFQRPAKSKTWLSSLRELDPSTKELMSVWAKLAAIGAGAFTLIGCISGVSVSASASTPGQATPTTVGAPNATRPCPGQAVPRRYTHVIWIFMENHSFGKIIGSRQAPFINSMASKCGLATNYHNITHPSLPNYIAATSGVGYPTLVRFDTDCNPAGSCLTSSASIFGQGETWRSYEETMPANCAKASAGLYAVRHNPAAYYTTLTHCGRFDVPFTELAGDLTRNTLPAFSFITPNLVDDMHNGTVADGDHWLATHVPAILNSREYRSGSTVLFITWDEGEGGSSNRCASNTTDVGCRVATLVISPSTRAGTKSRTLFNHYSLLGTAEQLLGLRKLNQANKFPTMVKAFRL